MDQVWIKFFLIGIFTHMHFHSISGIFVPSFTRSLMLASNISPLIPCIKRTHRSRGQSRIEAKTQPMPSTEFVQKSPMDQVWIKFFLIGIFTHTAGRQAKLLKQRRVFRQEKSSTPTCAPKEFEITTITGHQILDLCLWKTWSGKSHDYRDKLRFQNVFRSQKTKRRSFFKFLRF